MPVILLASINSMKMKYHFILFLTTKMGDYFLLQQFFDYYKPSYAYSFCIFRKMIQYDTKLESINYCFHYYSFVNSVEMIVMRVLQTTYANGSTEIKLNV